MKKRILLKTRKIISTHRAKRAPESKVVAVHLLPEEIAIAAAVLRRYQIDVLRPIAPLIDLETAIEADKLLDTVDDLIRIFNTEVTPS